jgi:hypothetical protein
MALSSGDCVCVLQLAGCSGERALCIRLGKHMSHARNRMELLGNMLIQTVVPTAVQI